MTDPAAGQARPTVVAVVGSPRGRSNTAALVAAALEELEAAGAVCETISLRDVTIAPCLAHDACADYAACPVADDAAAVLERVYAADCLVLGTPVYYENVSAQMKAMIDRSLFRYSHDQWLRAAAVGLVAVTAETGLQDALEALRRYVDALLRRRDPHVHLRRLRRRRRRGGRRRGAALRGTGHGPGARGGARPYSGLSPAGRITRFSVTIAVTGRSCASQSIAGTSWASKASATHGSARSRERQVVVVEAAAVAAAASLFVEGGAGHEDEVHLRRRDLGQALARLGDAPLARREVRRQVPHLERRHGARSQHARQAQALALPQYPLGDGRGVQFGAERGEEHHRTGVRELGQRERPGAHGLREALALLVGQRVARAPGRGAGPRPWAARNCLRWGRPEAASRS